MKLRALAGVLLCASLASGCDLSPQPLPPTAATPTGGDGTSSGSGATLGQPSSGSVASTGTGAGADAAAASGAAMTANGSAEDAGLAPASGEGGSSSPLDASADSTIPPTDAAFDSADTGNVVEDAGEEARDAASD